MLRMELLSSVLIRASLISVGYFMALHLAYRIKLSKRSVIDAVAIIGLMVLMSTRVDWILLKLMSYFVLGYLLLTLNHKINQYSALVFSLVVLIMTAFTDIISLNITLMSNSMMEAITHQQDNFYGFLAVMVPSLIVMSLYILSGVLIRKTLNLYNDRSRITYIVFSIFFLYLVVRTSLILEDIIRHSHTQDSLADVYQFISFMYFPIILFTVFSFYYFYQILKWEDLIKQREEELIVVEYKRRDGYRSNHNTDSIILMIHTLAKNKQYEELDAYLDKL